jgi:thymidine kinase
MFTEPQVRSDKRGWVEVICGCMFSGKTEELIRRMKRAQIANRITALFKPAIDNRYHEINIVSHDARALVSQPVDDAQTILRRAHGIEVIGIDEAQFFNNDIVPVCEALAFNGSRVIVAGLDMDYLGNPFVPVPQLLAVAEYITKLHAICVHCGNIANFSYRKSKHDAQIVVGETDIYEPRCRICFAKGEHIYM